MKPKLKHTKKCPREQGREKNYKSGLIIRAVVCSWDSRFSNKLNKCTGFLLLLLLDFLFSLENWQWNLSFEFSFQPRILEFFYSRKSYWILIVVKLQIKRRGKKVTKIELKTFKVWLLEVSCGTTNVEGLDRLVNWVVMLAVIPHSFWIELG